MKSSEVQEENLTPMNKGSPLDLDFCKVTMVPADHSSGCPGEEGGTLNYGGDPVGFILEIEGHRIYHAGDTNVFGDMEIITELYKPDIALMPIGGRFTMGPREAAYAICKYFPTVETFVPMHYDTFPLLKGRPADLEEPFAEFKHLRKGDLPKIVIPYDFHSEDGSLW